MNQYKALFRVDASFEIGMGHLRRCLSLAKLLSENNFDITFACRDLAGSELSLLNGYKVRVLEQSPMNEEQDFEYTFSKTDEFDVVVVDHYRLTRRWQSLAREHGKLIFVIDDLVQNDFDCDFLLNQNLLENLESRYLGKVPSSCRMFLGPRFTLFKRSILKQRDFVSPVKTSVKNIFVSYGGTDPTGEANKFAKGLSKLPDLAVKVRIAVGVVSHFTKELFEISKIDSRVEISINPENYAELVVSSDVGFGAGGSSQWERGYLGLPSIVTTISDNQLETTQNLVKNNLIFYLGHHTNTNPETYQRAILHYYYRIDDLNEVGSKFLEIWKGVPKSGFNFCNEIMKRLLIRP